MRLLYIEVYVYLQVCWADRKGILNLCICEVKIIYVITVHRSVRISAGVLGGQKKNFEFGCH